MLILFLGPIEDDLVRLEELVTASSSSSSIDDATALDRGPGGDYFIAASRKEGESEGIRQSSAAGGIRETGS